MVHFNKPYFLDRLQDLIQKINQCYWEHKSELLQQILLAPKQEVKNNWSNKSNPNSDSHQNQADPSNTNSHPNPNSNSNSNLKEKEKSKGSTLQPKKLTIQTNLVRMVNSPLRNTSVTSTTSSVCKANTTGLWNITQGSCRGNPKWYVGTTDYNWNCTACRGNPKRIYSYWIPWCKLGIKGKQKKGRTSKGKGDEMEGRVYKG